MFLTKPFNPKSSTNCLWSSLSPRYHIHSCFWCSFGHSFSPFVRCDRCYCRFWPNSQFDQYFENSCSSEYPTTCWFCPWTRSFRRIFVVTHRFLSCLRLMYICWNLDWFTEVSNAHLHAPDPRNLIFTPPQVACILLEWAVPSDFFHSPIFPQ